MKKKIQIYMQKDDIDSGNLNYAIKTFNHAFAPSACSEVILDLEFFL